MGLFRPYNSTGEPCFFEVYGSSTRLAFSRYFVVAHVDGFLYVLDKYFCISRLVPSRARLNGSSTTAPARRNGLLTGPEPPTGGITAPEANQTEEQGDGRTLFAEQQPTGVCSYPLATEEDQLEGSQLLVPVRIADVIAALFRTDKPVFSQLLTGNNREACLCALMWHQYDQRQLQGLRQKSLLLSNRQDGCLYLFLKKFLVRVSLRGTVTVVGDLLELALAAAIRLRVRSSLGSNSAGTATPTSSPNILREGDGSGRQGGSPPIRRICSVRQFCREMGHDEDTLPSGPDAVARRCLDRTPNCEDAAEEEQELESLGSDDASTQAWENLKSMHDWLHSPVEQYSDRLCAAGRLQEFVASRGEDWEVNNCCIDGEGRCFFTIARSKFLSPVEERGMIFCLDTKEPVARAVVLRFGRGITQSAVISLSLAAHPNSGCVLMVAKSGAEVRNGILNHGSSPLLSLATDCHPLQGDAGLTSMPVSLHDPSVGARTCRRDTVSAADQANTLPAVPRLSDTQGSSEAPSATEPAVTQEGSDDVLQRSRDSTQIRPSSLQQGTGDEAAGDPIVGEGLVQAGRTPVTHNSGRNLQPPNHSTAVREPTHGAHHEVPDALEGGGHKGSADEHSTWWFCPCDGDPSFFFPVAECFDDDAIHNAAQSICRQFRGIASSSVCRAHFEDDGGVALREAKAAAAAARTAEIMLVAAIQTHVPGESELGLKYPSAFPVTSAGKGCAAERAMRTAVLKALKEANLAASRAECAENSGYILWQPGVKVRRPKTGEEAISFGSAILFRARTTLRREPVTGWINGPPRSLQPARASDMITGELVAVISQDARHLEVRDAFPSPLGLIVVPAEAANRIVKQQSGDVSGRTSRSSISLTSFLASFIAGNPLAASERADQGVFAAPPVQGSGSVEDARPPAAENQLGESPSAGGMTSLGVQSNAVQDSIPRRAVPAVNIVFLVDTLRVCRLGEARRAEGSWGYNRLQPMCDQRLLGLADAATVATCEQPTYESAQGWKKNDTKSEQQSAAFGGLPTSDRVIQPDSDTRGGNSCSCRKANICLGDPPVLHSHFTDVTLLCADGFEVASHRALLAARCSFFEAKLTRPHWEARKADKVVIDLRDFAGSVVQATVRFFETGYFVVPASCCCPQCCAEQRRCRYEERQAPQQRGLPPYECRCCCKVDWVLQAYAFAAYCLLEDLKTELLAILARLTSQRTCLRVLTHPAVRNQRQILELAAHQLVYHMPMPNLLLEVDSCQEWPLPVADNSLPTAKETSPSDGSIPQHQRGRKPLLAELLSEEIYDVVIKALSAWVLDTQENIVLLSKLHFMRHCEEPSPRLRPRQLLVLLALRLLQESVTAPLSTISLCRELPKTISTISRAFSSGECHSVRESRMVPPCEHLLDKVSLVVPLRNSHDALRHFLFRDVVLLWAKVLDVPEKDAKAVAQGVEYSCLP